MIPCPACDGTGYGRNYGPDTQFCAICKGEAEMPDDYELPEPPDRSDYGDWLYDQWKDREAMRNG